MKEKFYLPGPRANNTQDLMATKSSNTTNYNFDYDYMLKFGVLGDRQCGKSNLVLRFCNDVFNAGFISSIGVDFIAKTIDVDTKRVKLEISDYTSSQMASPSFTSKLRMHAVLILFDLTDVTSFEKAKEISREIQSKYNDPIMILVGTKHDLEEKRTVDEKIIRKELDDINYIGYIETSSKNNFNVRECFQLTCEHYVKQNPIRSSQKIEMAYDEKTQGRLNRIENLLNDLKTYSNSLSTKNEFSKSSLRYDEKEDIDLAYDFLSKSFNKLKTGKPSEASSIINNPNQEVKKAFSNIDLNSKGKHMVANIFSTIGVVLLSITGVGLIGTGIILRNNHKKRGSLFRFFDTPFDKISKANHSLKDECSSMLSKK